MKNTKPPIHPPRWADRFLEWYCSAELIDEIQGDLQEVFYKRVQQSNTNFIQLWYLWNVLRFFRPSSFGKVSINLYPIMWTNYFKTAIRHFSRQKGYTFINISGLSVGLATALLIFLWVQDEVGYDKFHDEGDQLYRVMRNAYFSDGQIFTWAAIPMPLEKALKETYPEITHATLITWHHEVLMGYENEAFRERGRYAGKDFFDMFSYPFALGNSNGILDDPSSIVISAKLAERLFGEDWREKQSPLGQTLTVDKKSDFTIAGVFEDVPKNSTFRFDYIIPMEAYLQDHKWLEQWGNNSLRLFVKLDGKAQLEEVNQKIINTITDNHEYADAEIFLQPYKDIRLHSDFKEGKLVGGRITYVRLFTVVAFFILLIACINFMNLATARSSKRAREIGIRKIIGAKKHSLITQFLGESMMLSFCALIFALILVEFLLLPFNELTNKAIKINYLNIQNWLLFFSVAFGTGLLSGIYPAFFLSSFKAVNVLKGAISNSLGAAAFRKGLVVLQFTVSILLIIGTLTVYQQIQYIYTKNLGMDKENLVYFELEGPMAESFDSFKDEILKKPGIQHVTSLAQNPLFVSSSTGDPTWEGKDPEADLLFSILTTNYDALEVLDISLKDGRNFSREFSMDTNNYLVNEVAAKAMGMENPIGQSLEFWDQKGTIVGLVDDFHNSSLYEPIQPLILRLEPEETRMVYIRTEPGKTEEAIASLSAMYKKFNPGYPFDYTFLDDMFESNYKGELTIGKLTNYFTFIAFFISCLGLLGLASFMAEQRTKEIGIRKVLGASVSHLVVLLSRDFTWLVLIAFAIASPLAWYLMQDWLSGFAFHVEMGIGVFLLAGGASLLIAWLTIGYQSIKTAAANPVKSLRSE